MKYMYKLAIIGFAIAMMTGCANNVRSFKVDASEKNRIKKFVNRDMYVSKVNMPHGDSDGLMCRLESRIKLPEKMVFSSYIKDAFEKTLKSADRLAKNENNGTVMNIEITKVELNSISANWVIQGNVTLDNKKTVSVKSITNFGGAFMASQACNNASQTFDEAIADFVRLTLSKPELVAYLKDGNRVKVQA